MGTGIATSTIAQFERISEDIKYPTGLVLEAPFASVIDVVRASTIVKVKQNNQKTNVESKKCSCTCKNDRTLMLCTNTYYYILNR